MGRETSCGAPFPCCRANAALLEATQVAQDLTRDDVVAIAEFFSCDWQGEEMLHFHPLDRPCPCGGANWGSGSPVELGLF